jgi:hypothetical protein
LTVGKTTIVVIEPRTELPNASRLCAYHVVLFAQPAVHATVAGAGVLRKWLAYVRWIVSNERLTKQNVYKGEPLSTGAEL